MMNRTALALLVLAGCAKSDFAPSDSGRPNVLVILADDLGWSDLGCYGGEIATPALDGLARGGVRFTQFTNTARCWPTRAALLTGYYAQQVRRDSVPGAKSGSGGTRPAWAPLLPARLRELGYRSYHSGKWHVDGRPLDGGFDRSYQIEDDGRYFNPRAHSEDGKPLPPVPPGTDFYMTTHVAEHAVRVLRDHAREHAGKPFFHYLCFTAPHFPLHAPKADIDRIGDRYAAGWDAVRAERGRRAKDLGLVSHVPPAPEVEVGPPYPFPQAMQKLGPGEVNRPLPWASLTDEQRRFQAAKMAIHAAMVERMDREIGRVVEQLKSMGAFENTLIVFLSDNGASAEIMVRSDGHDPAAPPGSAASFLCLGPGWSSACNAPFRRHKTWVHEGGIATPLVAHWPAGIRERGGLNHEPGHVVDLAPTILGLAGGTAPPDLPGRSLFAPPADRDLWYLHEGNRALRSGSWKLVSAKNQGRDAWELYDLSKDRGETNDLAPAQPERVRAMSERWEARWKEIQARALRE
jgi:arylsulfatase